MQITHFHGSRRGITSLHLAILIVILLIIVGTAVYLAMKRPAPREMRPDTQMRKPAVATIIAEYDKAYDTDEYCVDGEIYEMRCEDSCGAGGESIMPKTAFLDCASPKRCCRYAPEEWPSFEEAPPLEESGR